MSARSFLTGFILTSVITASFLSATTSIAADQIETIIKTSLTKFGELGIETAGRDDKAPSPTPRGTGRDESGAQIT